MFYKNALFRPNRILEASDQIVYCTNVPELLRRAEKLRDVGPTLLRWGCDHGQGLLKVVLQPVYGPDVLDSVKSCFILAVCDAPETRFNLSSIFALLPSLDLTNPTNVFTSDLKVIFIVCIIRK